MIPDDRSLLIWNVAVLEQCDHTKMRLKDDSLERGLRGEIHKAWLVETYITSHNICTVSMMTSWYGNAFYITGPLWALVFIFVRLNKLLNKRIAGNLRRHETHMTSLWYYQCLLFYSALFFFFFFCIDNFCYSYIIWYRYNCFFNWLGYYSKSECLIGRYLFELTGQEMISSSIILLTAALRHHHLK